jgi:hypothetical protein
LVKRKVARIQLLSFFPFLFLIKKKEKNIRRKADMMIRVFI